MFQELPATARSISHRTLVFGHGINSADYLTHPTINGKRVMCPYYMVWMVMIQRCYDPKLHVRRPTYRGARVCNGWLYFTNFKEWMINQEWKGNELDKDILVPGNKHYSPDNCCFVSPAVNTLLCNQAAQRGLYPQGVSLHKPSGKYRATISINGKHKSLGYFDTVAEAEAPYRTAKSKHVREIAAQQTDIRVRDGLLRHAELIAHAI